jgi:hypothetical protein
MAVGTGGVWRKGGGACAVLMPFVDIAVTLALSRVPSCKGNSEKKCCAFVCNTLEAVLAIMLLNDQSYPENL